MEHEIMDYEMIDDEQPTVIRPVTPEEAVRTAGAKRAIARPRR
jgi:hypothetical protein